MSIILIGGEKGGTGKTTLAVNLAAQRALAERDVLIIDTDIHASGGLPNRASESADIVPMRRAGTAGEVADAVLYLLSDQASYITGAILNVSGGR